MNLENAISEVNQFQIITDSIKEQHPNITEVKWEIKELSVDTLKELRPLYTSRKDPNEPFATFPDGRLFFVGSASDSCSVTFISKPVKVVQTYEEI